MNKQEVSKIVFIIKATYPKYYANISAQEVGFMVEAWEAVFADHSYTETLAGLQAYIATDTAGFPPTPGQIIDRIVKIENPHTLTAAQSWARVYHAICNSIWHAAEEFEKLDEIEKRVVGSPEQLRQWGMADVESGELSVIQSNYLRSYNAALESDREDKKIPAAVRTLIQQTIEGFNAKGLLMDKGGGNG